MVKVLYNGNYIELKDELEPGYAELDLLSNDNDVNLEDTQELKFDNLENTKEWDFGDLNGEH